MTHADTLKDKIDVNLKHTKNEVAERLTDMGKINFQQKMTLSRIDQRHHDCCHTLTYVGGMITLLEEAYSLLRIPYDV